MKPKILTQLETRLKDQALAVEILREHGILKQRSLELTKHGKERDALGMRGRGIDRAVRASEGHTAADYKYSYRTHRATLKDN